MEAVDGCVDVDLGFTPSTNLLPIKRLQASPRKGNGSHGRMGRVSILQAETPGADLPSEECPDRALRERGGKFQRDLQINRKGVVIKYPGLWETEAME